VSLPPLSQSLAKTLADFERIDREREAQPALFEPEPIHSASSISTKPFEGMRYGVGKPHDTEPRWFCRRVQEKDALVVAVQDLGFQRGMAKVFTYDESGRLVS